MKLLSLLTLLVGFSAQSLAQELDVSVTVNTPNLVNVDPAVFKTLEGAMENFMNQRQWTDDFFEQEEKIGVNIQLTIEEELSNTAFKGRLSIQSTRPIYNSGEETVMLNHQDKQVSFNYEQFQPLDFSENQFTDNLVSILSFYAYLVIGMDYDSFAPFGGEPYFQQAQAILQTVPSSVTGQFKGWTAADGRRSRYAIMETLLSPRSRRLRQANYDYNRQALDIMAEEPTAGRAVMLDAIKTVQEVNRNFPNAVAVQMFANSKGPEIIEVFKLASPQEKNQVIAAMNGLDPAQASEYRAIK